MFQQESIMASWGSMFNISSGRIIIDEQTFSLVPNVALTAMAMNLGTKAYSTQTFPIDAIIGYKQIFMAWMAILLNDGTKVKVSIGTKRRNNSSSPLSKHAETPYSLPEASMRLHSSL